MLNLYYVVRLWDPPRGSVHNFGAAVRSADRVLDWTSDLDAIIK
jgi:hypothetical protein